MNRAIRICALLVVAGVLAAATICKPWVFSDQNEFLRNFVNHEFINFVAVIVTITLAVAGQIHLSLNRLEEQAGRRFLNKTRGSLHQSAIVLIATLPTALALVILKPIISINETWQSSTNSMAVIIILINIMVLWDLTALTFKIGPMINEGDQK